MLTESLVWAIFLLPVASFLLIGLVIRPLGPAFAKSAGYVTIAALGIGFILSVWLLRSHAHGEVYDFAPYLWLDLGSAAIEVGLLLDPLTNVMLVVVTGVSLMVQIYSMGYMDGDESFARYYAYMSLFSASMIGLVLAVNIVQMYVFWELVGLSSYLLIGFWHERPSAAAAAKKAFIITRIGDVGFLLAIIYLFFQADSFAAHGLNALHIPHIWEAAAPIAAGGAGIVAGGALLWLCLGLFAGAAGKSGQFPLHTWLPDAMEGPTPVSALIHAATMVAAGVFLVGRFFPVFAESQAAMMVVALIGAFTAVFAATMGLAANDIKRVMAYSTVSQLGYMMAALGVGAYNAALFHLFTHAFFKALLFLGAGSVNHAAGTFNMMYMGGLRKAMPGTYWLTVIGALSLVGIFPLAGFWSKDEILLESWLARGPVPASISLLVFVMLLVGVLLTAFYTYRMVHLTFHGEFRGGGERELHDAEEAGEPAPTGVSHHVHLGESPMWMVIPMGILGISAVVAGWLANPIGVSSIFGLIPSHWLTEYFASGLHDGHHAPPFSILMAVISNVVAIAGIGLAVLTYAWPRPFTSSEPLRKGGTLHTLLAQRYYMDHLYEGVIVGRVFYRTVAGITDWIDRNIVDGIVGLVGWISRNIGSLIALVQNGQVQTYPLIAAAGGLVIIILYLALG
ncbi:MAG: NADH-quinone oxidoreductase subunit L [Chloroflexota bacterium]|nr:NADH-quinone oxidoreductase subunit L [Chloroflexota bacterium]MDE2961701.1 NADH-quinone oxidoreductase subunit L [Chloroflexota bacterium]